MDEIDAWGKVRSRTLLEESGRIGFMARGTTFGIFAWLVFQAVQSQNAASVQGLNGALEWLRSLSPGSFLLGLAAFGLAAYGVYQYFLARYSEIKI